ncbi:MAG TPA: ABC transporter permease [Chloroflexia bacterium]|nr:ABC transporter permease [Chloroflexia bacterium]
MVTYVLRRVLAMIPSLFGIALITFTLMHIPKAGPFSSEHSNPDITRRLEKAYGLDQPLWPAFYGTGTELWQGALLVFAVLAIVGGIVLRRRKDAASQLGSNSLITVGAVSGVVFTMMLVQGPATRLTGSGFAPGQFLNFLWNVSHGDLGTSFTQVGRPVTDIVLNAAGHSFLLGLSAFVILVAVAIPLGMLAAVKQNTWIDYLASTFSLVGYSIPNFVMGVLLILVTGLWLKILPIAQWGEPRDVILPAFVLAIRPMAVLTRLTRASMLEVLTQDYIRTAWSKGLAARAVLFRHALRNSLLPVVTVMGDQLGDLVTGSLVVESLFNIPGIGQFFVRSVDSLDYGMIMGTTIFYAALVLLINLVVDLLYGVIDPRVRLGAAART